MWYCQVAFNIKIWTYIKDNYFVLFQQISIIHWYPSQIMNFMNAMIMTHWCNIKWTYVLLSWSRVTSVSVILTFHPQTSKRKATSSLAYLIHTYSNASSPPLSKLWLQAVSDQVTRAGYMASGGAEPEPHPQEPDHFPVSRSRSRIRRSRSIFP